MDLSRQRIQKIVELIILTAVVVLLQLVGNTIYIGEYSISLVLLPVVLGSIQCGPLGGAWLGFVFGLVLILAGETDTFIAISLFRPILCVVLRGVLTGFLSGLIYKVAKKKNRDLAIILTSIAVPLLNSSFFIILLIVFFYDFVVASIGSNNIVSTLISTIVSINFLIELAWNMMMAPILIHFVNRFENHDTAKRENNQKIRIRLATRLIVAVILLGVIICVVSAKSSYNSFKSSIENQYYGEEYQIEDIENTVRKSITNSIVMTICIEVIFITLYFYYISYMLIKPIGSISNEVSRFIESNNNACTEIKGVNTHDEIQVLADDIVKMEKDIGIYIKNITEVTAEKQRIVTELNIAKKIQADMLPSVFPAYPDRKDFDLYASMTPAKEVGGDFYDYFLLDDDHIALVIADVSDKGVPAALFMAIAKTLIKNQTSFTRSPKKILEVVNNQLCENNKYRMFITVWLCIMEISTGKCVVTNAGHEYPAIKKANGDFVLIEDEHDFVVGAIRNTKYNEYEFVLDEGGSLFVYTDGVTEANNQDDEYFETDRMIDALNKNSNATPLEIINNVSDAIGEFVGEAEAYDDITMLCIKRNKANVE